MQPYFNSVFQIRFLREIPVREMTFTSFPGFSPTRPCRARKGRVGKNPENEVRMTIHTHTVRNSHRKLKF